MERSDMVGHVIFSPPTNVPVHVLPAFVTSRCPVAMGNGNANPANQGTTTSGGILMETSEPPAAGVGT